MNEENSPTQAEVIGQLIGEVSATMLIIVEALRQQPSFDDEKFQAYIRTVLSQEDLAEHSRHMLSLLLSE